MDTSAFFAELHAGRLETADGAWQFARKSARPPLDRWIAKLWELDGSCPPAREREMPRGDISLIVNLAGRHAVVDARDLRIEHVFKDAWVTGLQEQSFITASGGRARLCGARLTVEGAFRLFGVAPRELANSIVDLDAVHGAQARELVDAMRNAANSDRRLTLLGSYITEHAERRCRWDSTVAWALDRISGSRGSLPVASVAKEIGWSRKHLHRRFVDQVGIAPKRCAQLARFHAAMLALERSGEERLAAAAQRLGYFDQAHRKVRLI
ncbi:MAG: helix-turn-helix domain-containing protein [Steroidobacteraceae bacterium]